MKRTPFENTNWRLVTPLALVLALFVFQACQGGSNPGKQVPDTMNDGTDLPPKPCAIDAQCNDGLFCTGTSTCVDGFCALSGPRPCGDDIACTFDYCDEFYETCFSFPDDRLCEAGFMCDLVNECVPTSGCSTDIQCDDGQPCTDDLCVDGSCTYAPDNSQCGTADFCSGAQICAPFLGCIAGSERNCDDADICTIDRCDLAAMSCVSDPKDSDGDTFIDAACGGDDCNDDNDQISPNTADVCDGIDNDCDGIVDDEDPFGARNPANAVSFTPVAGTLTQALVVTTPAGRRGLIYQVDDAGEPRVYLKIIDTDDSILTDPDVEVGLGASGPERLLAATTDGENIVVVRATAGSAAGTFDMLLDRFSAENGAKAINTVLVLDDQAGVRYIDVASPGGTEPAGVHVAWNDTRSGRPEVYVSEVQPAGIISSTPNALRFSLDDTEDSSQPRLTSLADGTTAVIWLESAGVVVGQLTLPSVSLQRVTLPDSVGATGADIHPLSDSFLAVYAEPTTDGQGLRAADIAPDLSNTPAEIILANVGGSISNLNVAGSTEFFGAAFTADITGVDVAYYLPVQLDPVLAGNMVEVGDAGTSAFISVNTHNGVTFALLSRPELTEPLQLVRSDCAVTPEESSP